MPILKSGLLLSLAFATLTLVGPAFAEQPAPPAANPGTPADPGATGQPHLPKPAPPQTPYDVEIDQPQTPQPVMPKAVIELFTSQGCSSCPPADKLLQTYAKDQKVIALSFPVDYWDYLGWKDTLASPRNAERQRAYAKARGDGAIYTPQIVVNGARHVNGARKADIDGAIEQTNRELEPQRVQLWFWQERNTLNIAVGPSRTMSPVKEATIWLGVVQTAATVDIKQGENAGKTLIYTNVVRELTPIGLWRGLPVKIQIPRTAVMMAETQKSVVLVQEGKGGPIIGAAWAGLF